MLNQPRGRIPQDWTVGGMRLLDVITNKEQLQQHDQQHDQQQHDNDGRILNRLPPTYKTTDFQQWLDECNGEDTPLSRHAVYQYISRDEDTLLIPFYDIHNHSNNPTKLNSHILKPKHPGKSFVLKSSRDIHPGEQIYISYNKCHPCWFDTTFRGCKSFSNYGSSDIFFVYGFVEDWPQYWNYKIVTSSRSSISSSDDDDGVLIEEVEFCVSPTSGEDNDDNELHVHFVDSDYVPSHEHVTWFAQHLLRLNEVKLSMKNNLDLKQSVPSHEWDLAWLYHESLVTSISLAIVEAIDSNREKREAAAANQQSLDGMLDESSCEE